MQGADVAGHLRAEDIELGGIPKTPDKRISIKYIINIINLERKWEEKPTQTTIQALEPSKLQQETQVSTVWF